MWNDMVENNMKTLSEIQNFSSKIVLAGGVFDIIHPGHINTLNAAKKLGDVLVVVVATDKTAIKMKKRKPLHSAQLRQELVSSLSMVDLCIIGDEDDIFNTVDLVKPQIIALGYDQTHQEKFIIDGCEKINLDVRVVRLESPRPDTSSSSIQKEYGEDIHGL
jgi:cytidyltransferase-like protein